MTDPVRILHVLGSLTYGGAELRTIEVAEELRDSLSFDFEFLALSGDRGPLEERCVANGFTVHHLDRSPMFPSRFLRILRERRIDIVHSHVHLFSGVVLWLSTLGGVAGRIAHFRSEDDGRRRNPYRFAYRNLMRTLVLRYATAVVTVSQSVMDQIWPEEFPSDSRFLVVPNGLDTEPLGKADHPETTRRQLGIKSNELLILHVGNFRPAKNQHRVMGIFEQALQRGLRARLVLAGTSQASLSNEAVDQEGMENIRQFVLAEGQLTREQIADRLVAADLMLFPSLWEGLPGAVLEACACGLTVLASDIPPIREIAEHFGNVTLLSLDESDDAWASALENLVRDDRPRDPLASLSEFSRTPYDLSTVSRRFAGLWSSQIRPNPK